MKRYLIITASLIILAALVFIAKIQTSQITPTSSTVIIPSPKPQEPKSLTSKASFKIITGNITRSFTNPKYHNLSADVFIQVSDPAVVHVKKSGVTWGDFFNTLPMKLTKECLTTGDGETFCDGKDGTLKFYLNDTEDKDLLEKQIHEGNSALIKFTSN